MLDRSEHALVVKALTYRTSNAVVWKDHRTQVRMGEEFAMQGLTALGIKNLVRDFVRSGGTVSQIRETREEWRDRYKYNYKVIVPIEGFRHGLYVEMVLSDDEDPEDPVVTSVNAHEQRK